MERPLTTVHKYGQLIRAFTAYLMATTGMSEADASDEMYALSRFFAHPDRDQIIGVPGWGAVHLDERDKRQLMYQTFVAYVMIYGDVGREEAERRVEMIVAVLAEEERSA